MVLRKVWEDRSGTREALQEPLEDISRIWEGLTGTWEGLNEASERGEALKVKVVVVVVLLNFPARG